MFLRWKKKSNTAKLVDMNFLADSVKYSQVISLAKIQAKTTVFCKSYQNVPIRVFLHEEFISALKTEPKSMGFEKYAKNGIKISIIVIFFSLVIFCKHFKQKLIIPIESCFSDGKKINIAKLVDMNFLADNVKNRQAIAFTNIQA